MANKTAKKKASKKAKKHKKPIAKRGFWQQQQVLYGIGAVLVITFLAFLPTFQNEFVNWDDREFIYENESIQSLSFENIKSFFTTNVLGAYAPLVFLSFAVEYKFFELDPFYYHLNNLLLHLGCVFLVYRIGLQLGLRTSGAIVLALLFGIHPMRVESVAWATERKDVLFGIFYLSGIFYYLKYHFSNRTNKKYFGLVLLFFVLSLFSKIQAVAFPLTLLAIDYYLKRPLNLKLVIEKAPYFLLSLAIGLLGVSILSSEEIILTNVHSFVEKLFLGGYTYIIFLTKIIFPYEMVTLYPLPADLKLIHYVVPVLIAPLFYGIWLAFKKVNPIWVFGFVFYTFNIMFMLQILGAGQGFQADRYTYMAYFGLFFIMAFYAQQGLENRNWNVYYKLGMGLYFLLFFGMTWQQTKVWKNGATLWTHVTQHYGDVSTPWANLGQYYRNSGQTELALSSYNKALEITPTDAGILNSRGKLHFDASNTQLAFKDYNAAILADPSFGEAYINRGVTYGLQQQYTQAITDISKGLEFDTDNLNGYLNRGLIYSMSGQYEKSIQDNSSYLALNPFKPEIWYERAIAKRRVGKDNEALPDFNQAIKLEQRPLFYLERGKLHLAMGNKALAIQDGQQAQALGSKDAAAFLQQIQ